MSDRVPCAACGIEVARPIASHRRVRSHREAVERLGSDPSIVRPRPRESHEVWEAKFWSRVDRSGGPDACWPWLGSRSRAGYGHVYRDGLYPVASRVALELSLGRALGPKEQACHRCDNPPCVNAAHLFVGSPRDNVHDSIAKGRHTSKIDASWVEVIRSARESGVRVATLAAFLGVTEAQVRHILIGRSWTHLPERARSTTALVHAAPGSDASRTDEGIACRCAVCLALLPLCTGAVADKGTWAATMGPGGPR